MNFELSSIMRYVYLYIIESSYMHAFTSGVEMPEYGQTQIGSDLFLISCVTIVMIEMVFFMELFWKFVFLFIL